MDYTESKQDIRVPAQSDFQAARQGVIGVIVRRRRLLVIRRSRHVVAPGMLCFPGGGIEPGESQAAALRRELLEELGAAAEPIRPLWRSRRDDLALFWWQAELPADRSLVPNPLEVASLYWLTIKQLARACDLLETNRAFIAAVEGGQVTLW